MNFFEQQDAARRQSRWLLALFALAVLLIVAAVDLAVLSTLGLDRLHDGDTFSFRALVASNVSLLAIATLATLAVIGLASLFRILRLKSGGGQVARELGAQPLDPQSADPLHRRLRNVVEEIALASGVPVPEIYVLEQEHGINAFAAGFTIADAAVTVTRGALEKLDRNELQGVIAHEFSHIFNGDMRMNVRLMGVLFGILVLAVVGRRVLVHTRHVRSSRNNGAGAVLLIAGVLMVVGYVGLFFGRWIKAAVSRQREYLADASAVQFTRDPDSIGGALKKIAVYSEGSLLRVETEEVGHMLFGMGRNMRLFATHPPLLQRIRRVDPDFREEDLDRLAERIRRERERAVPPAEGAAAEHRSLDAGGIMGQIGNPDWGRLLAAAAIMASLPDEISRAARSREWAVELLLASLLDDDPELRERQLLMIATDLGGESEGRVRSLRGVASGLTPEQRLPVLELALPAVKQRSQEAQVALLRVVERVTGADGRIDAFEYLLARLIRQYLWEAQNPRRAARAGHESLARLDDEARTVLAVLARHGQSDEAAAEHAFRSGMAALGSDSARLPPVPDDWTAALDRALDRLDRLDSEGRQTLVAAMIETATADRSIVTQELELLRAVCASLHVPVPTLQSAADS